MTNFLEMTCLISSGTCHLNWISHQLLLFASEAVIMIISGWVERGDWSCMWWILMRVGVVCDGTENTRCMTDAGWTLHRDHAQTVVVSNDRDYLVLSLVVGGFHGDAGARAAGSDSHHQQIAELSFEFETHCSHECYFALLRVCLSVSVFVWAGQL